MRASMADTPTGPIVRQRWEEIEAETSRARLDYWLNRAFYKGHQWLYADTHRNTIRSAIPRNQNAPHKVRATINKIKPNLNTLCGKFLQSDLTFEVPASASDDASLTGARLAEYVLEAARSDDGWEHVRERNLFNTLLGGVAAVALHPAGDGVSVVAGKESGTLAKLEPLSIAQFGLQPGSRSNRDAMWWIQRTAVPPEIAQARYDLDETPKADATAGLTPVTQDGTPYSNLVDQTVVYVYYERPNKWRPKGAAIHVIGDEIVEKGDWPFDFDDRLNLYVFSADKADNDSYICDTFVTNARPLQAAYNFTRSQILETSKYAGAVKLLVPIGSINRDDMYTDQSGEHLDYDPDAGRPDYLTPPQLQRWLTQQPAEISAEIDDIMYVHDISRGEAPGDRNSGLALSILAEKDETPLGMVTRDQAHGWGEIGEMYLMTASKQATGERLARYETDEGVPIEVRWSGAMLAGQTRVRVPLDATSPYSRAARMAQLTALKQEFPSIFDRMDPAVFVRIADFPGLKDVGNLIDADAAKAIRENHLMAVGEPQIPEPYDDHGIHLAELNRFRKTQKFASLPLSTQRMFDKHALAHERLQGEEAAMQALQNQVVPGVGALPQANAPIGSMMPTPVAEQGQMPPIM